MLLTILLGVTSLAGLAFGQPALPEFQPSPAVFQTATEALNAFMETANGAHAAAVCAARR